MKLVVGNRATEKLLTSCRKQLEKERLRTRKLDYMSKIECQLQEKIKQLEEKLQQHEL